MILNAIKSGNGKFYYVNFICGGCGRQAQTSVLCSDKLPKLTCPRRECYGNYLATKKEIINKLPGGKDK